MEETEDTIIIRKKDVVNYLLYISTGIVVVIGGLAMVSMVINWGGTDGLKNPMYALFFCTLLILSVTFLIIGFVLINIGEIRHRLDKLEETLIKEIREVNHLDENLP
jgi:uncharacterized membrane protein